MCQGGEKQQRDCPNATVIKCTECGTRYDAPFPESPPPCPSCKSTAGILQRCERCPVLEIEHVRSHSAAGALLERVLELDFDAKHFRIGWDEVTAEEAWGLKVLDQERGKWQKEDTEEKRRQWEAKQMEEASRQKARDTF